MTFNNGPSQCPIVIAEEEDMEKNENLRIAAFAKRVGYTQSTIRKKVWKRELDSIKVGRLVLIPATEVDRLLADFRPRIEIKGDER